MQKNELTPSFTAKELISHMGHELGDQIWVTGKSLLFQSYITAIKVEDEKVFYKVTKSIGTFATEWISATNVVSTREEASKRLAQERKKDYEKNVLAEQNICNERIRLLTASYEKNKCVDVIKIDADLMKHTDVIVVDYLGNIIQEGIAGTVDPFEY